MSIAQSSTCYSKNSQFLPSQPDLAYSSEGCTLTTNKGIFVDYICGLGSNILDIQNNYSLEPRLLEQTARAIKNKITFIESIKFLKTGSEACQAAVKIALESASGPILSLGYHGWHTELMDNAIEFKSLNALLILAKNKENLVVIVEPVMLDIEVKEQLQDLRYICHKNNHVLIFDEVVSCFRFPKFCASQYFGVIPDLIILGKALANGYPLACVGGSKKYMEGDYFVSSTFASEHKSLDKCCETMDLITSKNTEELWWKGEWFQEQFNLINSRLQIVGYPTRGEMQGPHKWLFQQEMSKHGFLFGTCWFITHAHTKEILKDTLDAAAMVLNNIEHGKVKLESAIPKLIFERN